MLVIAVCFYFVQGPRFLRHPADHFGDKADGLLNTWLLAWDTHALLEGGGNVWDPPIFYPVKNTLTFSETMFGDLWLAAPVNYLTGNAILAANLHILACFVLGAYCTFLLVQRLTGSFAGGLAAGVMYAFNPLLWAKLEFGHMNLLAFHWAPLALLCCHYFLETRSWKSLIGTVLALVAQYYTSINLGLLLTTTLLCFGGVYCLCERQGWDRLFFVRQPGVLLKLVVVGGLGIVCLGPLVRPYLRTVNDWDIARSQAENVTNSNEPLALIVPERSAATYRAWSLACMGRVRGNAGLGFAPWLLALAALWIGRARLLPSLCPPARQEPRRPGLCPPARQEPRRPGLCPPARQEPRRPGLCPPARQEPRPPISSPDGQKEAQGSLGDEQRRVLRRFGWTALCVMVLMWGPRLVWCNRTLPVPLPFMVLYHCLPGAQGFRVPGRFVMPLLLCLSVLSGFTVAWLAAAWPRCAA